jgi:hypothetical protein
MENTDKPEPMCKSVEPKLGPPWKHRTTEQARDALRRFIDRTPPIMSIPLDNERDADCILYDVLAERDALALNLLKAQDLLLERERENAELLALVVALVMALEVHGAHAVGCSKLAELPNCTCGLDAAMTSIPAAALAIERARRAVVEAAKALHQVEVNQADAEGAAEFSEYLWKALEDLKNLESKGATT